MLENRQWRPAIIYCRYKDDFVVIVKGTKAQAQAEAMREECRSFLEDELKLSLNMDKTHVTHVDDGFVFLGHRIIRKRGSLVNKRIVTTIPKDKFKHFAAKLVNELYNNYSENKIDLIVRLNRKLSGWASFYQFTDYTAVMFGKLDQIKLDQIMFWKIGYWLAIKFRTPIKALMKQWFRRPEISKVKTWVLHGRNGKGNLEGVVLKRLVTSRKS